MKVNIYKLLSIFAVLFVFAACEDSINHPNQNKIPLAVDINTTIEVNQETNEVTFLLNNPGCNPVWIFDGKTYSTVNGYSKIFPKAGTYQVEVKISNAHGVSDGTVVKEFTLNQTIIDFTKYYTLLAGTTSKQWAIAKKEKGHIACGPAGSDGYEWYSAFPMEKEATGMYENILTFSTEKNYTFNPGTSGTVYVNASCDAFPQFNVTGEDYRAAVEEYTVDYSFDTDGEDVFLVLESKAFLPYIPTNQSYHNPRFRVESIKSNRLDLIADNGEIAWHIILAPYDENDTSDDEESEKLDPNSPANLWTNAVITNSFFYTDHNWNQIADPTLEIEDRAYTLFFPTATSSQWQAQVQFITDIAVKEVNRYDFCAVIESDKDIAGVVVKLVDCNDDENFIFETKINLNAYEEKVVLMADYDGINADAIKLVFDFGGNPDQSEVIIRDIVFKDHSK